jgi:hypothetical protein
VTIHRRAQPGSFPTLVHLLRPGASGQDELLACRAACEIPNVHHLVWLIGNTRDERDARSLGLRISARFSPRAANLGPIARLVRPGGAMMPHANRLDASAQVLCWGTPTLDIARALRIPIAAAVLLDSRDIRTTDLHRTPAIAFCNAIASAWRTHGHQVAVLTPPYDLLSDGEWLARRQDTRTALRIGADEVVISLLSDPVRDGDARRFAWVTGLLQVAGIRAVGICAHASSQLQRAARYIRLHGRHWEVIAFDGPPAAALPAADLVMWNVDPSRVAGMDVPPRGPAGGAGLLSAMMAARHGVPVFSPIDPASDEFLGTIAPELLATAATMPALGACAVPLLSDPHRRAAVGQRLASHLAAPSNFVDTLARKLGLAEPRSGTSVHSHGELAHA